MSKTEFIQMVKGWGRKEMLKLTRRWGFIAHKKNDDQVAEFLWDLKQQHESK